MHVWAGARANPVLYKRPSWRPTGAGGARRTVGEGSRGVAKRAFFTSPRLTFGPSCPFLAPCFLLSFLCFFPSCNPSSRFSSFCFLPYLVCLFFFFFPLSHLSLLVAGIFFSFLALFFFPPSLCSFVFFFPCLRVGEGKGGGVQRGGAEGGG
jgi:hypothetical protein